MKNYCDQLHELNIAKIRLKTLLEKKDLYFNFTQPGGMNYDNEKVMGGKISNCFDNYVVYIEDIDKKIFLVKSEISILQENLKNMEKVLREIKEPLVQIFVARDIDGLSINEICKKFHYSRAAVYKKLKIIKKKSRQK